MHGLFATDKPHFLSEVRQKACVTIRRNSRCRRTPCLRRIHQPSAISITASKFCLTADDATSTSGAARRMRINAAFATLPTGGFGCGWTALYESFRPSTDSRWQTAQVVRVMLISIDKAGFGGRILTEEAGAFTLESAQLRAFARKQNPANCKPNANMHSSRGISSWQIKNVFHPSDFSDASEIAFAHALKFALLSRARLSMLHVATESGESGRFPGVRETLERWGAIPPESGKDAVSALGMDVRKVVEKHGEPVHVVLSYLKRHPADLIVLATHQYQGKERWFKRSVAEPIARRAGQMTLFVPHGVVGFVSRDTGVLSLRKVLVPVAEKPSPVPAIDAAVRAATSLGISPLAFTLLHVGQQSGMPDCPVKREEGWVWEQAVRSGDVVEQILQAAADTSADLIVMSTSGRSGFLDALRGSTTEQVLRQARCPVLAVPVGGYSD